METKRACFDEVIEVQTGDSIAPSTLKEGTDAPAEDSAPPLKVSGGPAKRPSSLKGLSSKGYSAVEALLLVQAVRGQL